MEGYLQALIDRYQRLQQSSLGDKRGIYREILIDLKCMGHYIDSKKITKDEAMEPLEVAGQKKRIAMIFTGKSADLSEFLKEKMRGVD